MFMSLQTCSQTLFQFLTQRLPQTAEIHVERNLHCILTYSRIYAAGPTFLVFFQKLSHKNRYIYLRNISTCIPAIVRLEPCNLPRLYQCIYCMLTHLYICILRKASVQMVISSPIMYNLQLLHSNNWWYPINQNNVYNIHYLHVMLEEGHPDHFSCFMKLHKCGR